MFSSSCARSGRSLSGMMWSTVRSVVAKHLSQNGLSLRKRAEILRHVQSVAVLPLRPGVGARFGRHSEHLAPDGISRLQPKHGRCI